jgi:hypothetical protein
LKYLDTKPLVLIQICAYLKGRNISEAHRLIQDVIEYTDREDDDGIIIFLDQQKAFDRVEWGWVDHVLSKFNFGEKFREWVQMLFKYAQTCIKTNGFVSKYFNISRSCRQGCPIAPLVYILQAEPVACAIRGDSEIQGIKLPGGEDGEYIKTRGHNFSFYLLLISISQHFVYYNHDECQEAGNTRKIGKRSNNFGTGFYLGRGYLSNR